MKARPEAGPANRLDGMVGMAVAAASVLMGIEVFLELG
jgi:hypothetical protein